MVVRISFSWVADYEKNSPEQYTNVNRFFSFAFLRQALVNIILPDYSSHTQKWITSHLTLLTIDSFVMKSVISHSISSSGRLLPSKTGY